MLRRSDTVFSSFRLYYFLLLRSRRVETVAQSAVSYSVSREPPPPPEPEFVPYAADRPVGLDMDEFLPVSCWIVYILD